jgi:quinol monooxygenase YgiN
MNDQVAWRVELSVKPNQLENFLALTGEMVDVASTEEGCLSYQRFINADDTIVHVYERYQNSGAALEHLATFSRRFGARYSGMVDRKSFTVFGNLSSELKKVLDQFSPLYLRPFGYCKYWS